MFPKGQLVFVTAAGTPIDEDGILVEESLRGHLRHHIEHDIDGFLIAGSMGQMACLTQQTWLDLGKAAVAEAKGKAKILLGIGDTSFERTRDRIEALRGVEIDAVVATTPYYFRSEQADLIYYFTKIADLSPVPLFLYDLPQATKVKTEMETMLELSRHPNIGGAKCSHDPVFVRRLADATADLDFEVISAQFDLIDVFAAAGILLQLDGFFCLVPRWLKEMKEAHRAGDQRKVTEVQHRLTTLRNKFAGLGMFPAFTRAMNLLGFPGQFHPSHMAPFDESKAPDVNRLLTEAGLL
jgi:4-hydroxy-tetrahydrodipicolinate synthase